MLVEMGSDQTILAVSMRRQDCAAGRETDSVSELVAEGKVYGLNKFIEYNSRHPMDGLNL